MRKFVLLAGAAAILSAASPSLAQIARIDVSSNAKQWVDNPALAPAVTDPATLAQIARIDVPSNAQQWVDNPALAPAVTDPATRARMNAEIVAAIAEAGGDQDQARAAIAAIAARYQEAAAPQGARTRPGPK